MLLPHSFCSLIYSKEGIVLKIISKVFLLAITFFVNSVFVAFSAEQNEFILYGWQLQYPSNSGDVYNDRIQSVSYTHLDVYKRQAVQW